MKPWIPNPLRSWSWYLVNLFSLEHTHTQTDNPQTSLCWEWQHGVRVLYAASSSLLVLKISYPGYRLLLFVLCARKMWPLWGNVVKWDDHPLHAFAAENVLSQE
jgi:hypothetical protein